MHCSARVAPQAATGHDGTSPLLPAGQQADRKGADMTSCPLRRTQKGLLNAAMFVGTLTADRVPQLRGATD